MRWFKNIVRAILALLPCLGIATIFITSPNTSAMSHELNGIRWAVPITSTTDFGYEENVPDISTYGGFYILFPSDVTYPYFENRDVFYSGNSVPDFKQWYRMYPKWENGTCTMDYGTPSDSYDLKFIGYNSQSNHSFSAYLPYAPSLISDENDYAKCFRLGTPYSSSLPFKQESLSNIRDIRGDTSPRGVYVDNMEPYWYSADGFWTHAHHINTNTGESYESAFYLSEMFGGFIPNKFSTLTLPIYNSEQDESCTNSFSERDFEFKAVFNFDGSAVLNPNLGNNSLAQVAFQSSGNENISPFVCRLTVTQLQPEGDGTKTQVQFSCPGTFPALSNNSIITGHFMIQAYDSNSDPTWFFDTTADFSFGGLYIITDGNDTEGCSLHDDLTGNHIGGDYTDEDQLKADSGSFGGLTNLFNFQFINPFQPLFDMFTSGDSCASIPTLAGMIHSEQTQVCPFFDSTTRAVVESKNGQTCVCSE